MKFEVTITPKDGRADVWVWSLDSGDGQLTRGEAHGTYDFAQATAESSARAIVQSARGATSYTFNAATGERT